MARLNVKKVVKLIRRKEKGLSSVLIAQQLRITKRRVNQVWAEYQKNGSFKLNKPGKVKTRVLSKREECLILKLYDNQKVAARVIGKLIRRRYEIKIGNDLIHEFLLDKNMAEANKNKQGRRKPWVRYERKHSLSAVHLDWHTSKWKEGLQVCTVIDDASRKILAGIECKHATEKETIKLVTTALKEYGHIRRIREAITDHGTQFFNNTPDKHGNLAKNTFQKFLDEQGIKHILCKYKHPQTNGKQEKWFHTYERHRKDFTTFKDFLQWYNETRVHESLDLRTPEKVFRERLEPFIRLQAGKFLRRWNNER